MDLEYVLSLCHRSRMHVASSNQVLLGAQAPLRFARIVGKAVRGVSEGECAVILRRIAMIVCRVYYKIAIRGGPLSCLNWGLARR